MKDRYSIGIDPGANTGYAVYDRQEKKLIAVETLDFWRVINKLYNYQDDFVYRVVVELPQTKKGKTNKHVWHKEAQDRGAIERTGVNVGASLREAELIIKWCQNNGYNVLATNPQGKVDKDVFKKMTGWEGRTSPHARDAGMLVWGM